MRKLLADFKTREHPPTKSWVTMTDAWSRHHSWVERAAEYDRAVQRRAIEAHEAHWREKVMGSTEVLGRLSEHARVSVADFVTVKLVPTTLVIPLSDDDEGDAPAGVEQGFVQVVELNAEAIKVNGHLIKSITPTKWGPRIELHDGQSALVQLGRYHKLFVDQAEVKSTVVQMTADDMAEARSRAHEYEKGLLNDRPGE